MNFHNCHVKNFFLVFTELAVYSKNIIEGQFCSNKEGCLCLLFLILKVLWIGTDIEAV